MREAHTRLACAVAVLLVALSLSAPVVAQDGGPETADEYLEAFRDLEGREAFEEYSEFEVVRAQAVSEVQVGTFTDAKRQRMALVYDVLVAFDEAYRAGADGSNVESLERATAIEESLSELRSAGGSQYVALTNVALDRFYRNQGESLLAAADATNQTRSELRLLDTAATAYKRGGAVDRYSKLAVRSERLRTAFRSDLRTLNNSTGGAQSFLSSCGAACESPVGALTSGPVAVFERYADARAARTQTATAAAITAEHGMTERGEAVQSLREQAGSAVVAFAAASAGFALGFALVVALVAMLVAHRLAAWARDVEDSQTGDIVLMEEVIHG